jgi:hypothetical protein
MRSRTEELALMRVKNAALEERIKVLEAKLEPKPAPRAPPPPAWAGSGDPNMTGMNAPAPSVSQQAAAGIVGVRPDAQGDWVDPFGQKRNSSGVLIPHSIAGMVERRPDGPLRSPQHEEAIRILDDGLSDK